MLDIERSSRVEPVEIVKSDHRHQEMDGVRDYSKYLESLLDNK
jgi:hypothetical protein